MSFVVYTHSESHRSSIHLESCSEYQTRKPNALPPSHWYGPYMTLEEAGRKATDHPNQPWTVSGCRKCGTDAEFL